MRNYWLITLYGIQLAWISGREPYVFLLIICLLSEMFIAVAGYSIYKIIFGPERMSGLPGVFGAFMLAILFYFFAVNCGILLGELPSDSFKGKSEVLEPYFEHKNYILLTSAGIAAALATELRNLPLTKRYMKLYKGVYMHTLKVLTVGSFGLLIASFVFISGLHKGVALVSIVALRILVELYPKRLYSAFQRIVDIRFRF